ncbi:MAG: hypothetical protein H5T83_14120 [Actinotalea sp.]|nr:hypothetical protein [Actinotalea sp.]
MDRPHGSTDRVVADAARRSAAEHAQRVAHLARRRAAARRRALLTAVLLVAVVAGWTLVVAVGAPLALGAVPSAALLSVLALGRAAVRSAARADAAWAAGAHTRLPVDRATAGARTVGRAVRPSDARTEVLARVPRRRDEHVGSAAARPVPAAATPQHVTDRRQATVQPAATVPQQAGPVDRRGADASVPATATAVPTQRPEVEDGVPHRTSAWSPVPVPPPSYVLKPSAPRREPAPLPADEHLATPAAGTRGSAGATPNDGAAAVTPPVGPAAGSTGSLDLDAILARRRASGE